MVSGIVSNAWIHTNVPCIAYNEISMGEKIIQEITKETMEHDKAKADALLLMYEIERARASEQMESHERV